jgi:hypothetical protein
MTGNRAEEVHPTNAPRRPSRTAPARASIEIELVFEAKIAPAGAFPSRSDQKRRFTSTSSKIASTTRPAAAASPTSEDARTLASVSSRALGSRRPFATGPLEVAGDPVETRLGPREFRLVEHDASAARREHLGDSVAHQPRAADEDVLDRHRVRA